MSHSCTEQGAHTKAAATRAQAQLQPRRSRAGRWRAIVLIAVHVAIALHVAHWASTGKTLSPLEPSESMAFSQRGVVNAGVIFFALAIGSTLLFGRWFCGWACHLVAVQDGARWLLGKMGIRPRPVNLGLLASVPWLAFVYMFLSPIVLSLLADAGLAAPTLELETEQFWKTFPPWPVAVLTLAVSGFGLIYLLGAKGFCTYGCPYGAIFGITDQLAPLRIRVTDACMQCGHCTVACTSNVNVSQEVRDWGMVVDPGCMKCLDCVSVCPKHALYVGWGVPALFARSRQASAGLLAASKPWLRHALLLAFMFTVFVVLHLHDGRYGAYLNAPEWKLSGVLAAGTFAVALVFRGKTRRVQDYSLGEEFVLAAGFVVALLCFRGLHGWIPLLLALGVSAVLAWLVLQALRISLRRELAWKNWRLKSDGRFTRAGQVFAGACVLVGLAWGTAAREQQQLVSDWRGRLGGARKVYDQGLLRAQAGDFGAAIKDFEGALELDPNFVEALENLAGALCAAGRYEEGLAQFESALHVRPGDASTHFLAARAALGLGDPARARQHLDAALRIDPGLREAHLLLAGLLEAEGDTLGAAREREAAGRAGTSAPR